MNFRAGKEHFLAPASRRVDEIYLIHTALIEFTL